MNISREHIGAFLALVRKNTFSAAAESLNLTQAAFSIRIQRLEDELQSTLVIRNKSGISLTEAGKKFLNYSEMIENLENEFLNDFKESKGKLKGTIRIGTFSTIGRSIVMPAFSQFMRVQDEVSFSYLMREISELPNLLTSSEIDFLFLDYPLKKEGIESVYLGDEEYVLISSKVFQTNQDIYLNHDEKDQMSFKYLEAVGSPAKTLKRRFLDEIYGVIDGVAAGWGVSVLPKHLIQDDERIKLIQEDKALLSPVYLHYRIRPYYPEVFKTALEIIRTEIPKFLRLQK
jgi:DNA-binding transcriptional LysR family regulator